MELCRRTIEFIQVCNEEGEVRICGWLKDGGIIGRLTDNAMEEIYHSAEAELIRAYHANKDYSNCNPMACPFVANNNVEENFIQIDEIPKFPPALYLAYENVCNYRCVMCGVHDCEKHIDAFEREKKLDKVDEELLKILPYVKKISANGLGELFVSKHTMKLLSEWRPIADPSECSVVLETNGSLFNEKNWSKISNLGQYHLEVAITVLSFDEDTYQALSGTTLPISNLIDNLRFVKSLREQGIINHLTIATVYQEKNFRELPQFAKRCIDEFAADYVRLRPVDVWGGEADMVSWFRDVRNEYHPYHKEFLEIMKDPILKHPKVHNWGGDQPSGLGPEPYVRTRAKYNLIENIFCNENFEKELEKIIEAKAVVYGMTAVGKALASVLKDHYEVPFLLDRAMNGQKYAGIPIFAVNHLSGLDRDVTVIVALDRNEEAVVALLKREGFKKVISINDLVRNK